MSPTTIQSAVCGSAMLAAAMLGYVAPPRRGRVQLAEVAILLVSIAMALSLRRDWVLEITLGAVVFGVYYSFGMWRTEPADSRTPFNPACVGTAWLLMQSTHSWAVLVIGTLLAIGGPFAARWLVQRTGRQIGLLLITAAILLQFSRVAVLLAS